jgi:hypothetical protein
MDLRGVKLCRNRAGVGDATGMHARPDNLVRGERDLLRWRKGSQAGLGVGFDVNPNPVQHLSGHVSFSSQ